MNKKGGLVLSVIIIVVVFVAGFVFGNSVFNGVGLAPEKVDTGIFPRGQGGGVPDLTARFANSGGGGCGQQGNVTICSFTVDGFVENIGNANARNFYSTVTDITNNETIVSEIFISDLAPGEEVFLNVTYRGIPPGVYLMQWFADSRESVTESNESNNKDTMLFRVPPS